ncbi:MAG TPA: carboxymuconolactone decarboxylase family protein [Gemmatimonadaceae bacterium]|nr:carboxymuconolactone decarboxylase family protein [Gemmatimonadaceae bacterium]
MSTLDEATRRLVRVAAIVSAGSESEIRDALLDAERTVPHLWIEELLLQTYLFAGFPRTLNAFREWRRRVPTPADPAAPNPDVASWTASGQATCRAVYGDMYERLRENIGQLHPALDSWMIVEGYGKVLSRPGLDLPRRELCIIAACVASGQDRQLHSHLHGALNVGVAPSVVRDALESLRGLVPEDRSAAARLLFARVTGK